MAWLDASTRQEFPVPHCPPLVIVPANRFVLRLKSLLPIWVLMAHSSPDSASCRARTPWERFLEICGSTAPSDIQVIVRRVNTLSKTLARDHGIPRSSPSP